MIKKKAQGSARDLTIHLYQFISLENMISQDVLQFPIQMTQNWSERRAQSTAPPKPQE